MLFSKFVYTCMTLGSLTLQLSNGFFDMFGVLPTMVCNFMPLRHSLWSLSLVGYTDADWAGCPTTCRFTFGYCVFLGNNLISWSSKRQVTLSHSSAEAEYRVVTNVVAETTWIHNLLRELHSPSSTDTLVYCDNVSTVYLPSNPMHHQWTKHIEIDIH